MADNSRELDWKAGWRITITAAPMTLWNTLSPHPEGSTTYQTTVTRWGLSVQTHKVWGNIFYWNHNRWIGVCTGGFLKIILHEHKGCPPHHPFSPPQPLYQEKECAVHLHPAPLTLSLLCLLPSALSPLEVSTLYICQASGIRGSFIIICDNCSPGHSSVTWCPHRWS